MMPKSKLLLAGGSIMPTIEKFLVSREEWHAICRNLYYAVHPGDLIVLGFFSLCSVRLVRIICGKEAVTDKRYAYQIASHVAQAAQLAVLVYLFDVLVIVLSTLGFDMDSLSTLSKGFAKIVYISWLGTRFSAFKRYLLGKAFLRASDKLGRASTIDRLLGGLIFMVIGMILLDILDVDMGVGVTSIFAFGSAEDKAVYNAVDKQKLDWDITFDDAVSKKHY